MLILKIPEPCHQSWDEMTPESKGRFCGSCQKIVVDFTQMSDEQVKRYLFDNRNTCGRFLSSQIGRPFENKSIHIDPVWYRQLPFARQVFYAVALFFVLGVSSCDIRTSDGEKNELNIIESDHSGQNKDVPALIEKDSIHPAPPKVKIINHPGPVLTGDVIITQPGPVRELQGAPIWQEEPSIDTTRGMMGKIAVPEPPKIDSIKASEPMIMGGISVPITEIKDSTTKIIKPRP